MEVIAKINEYLKDLSHEDLKLILIFAESMNRNKKRKPPRVQRTPKAAL